MIYRLIALNGAEAGLRWSVSSSPMTLGRDPSCEIRLADPEVAARHAEIRRDGDALRIRDLGSMNRILVNRHEVREARLKHGDTVEIGLTRLMVEALVQADVAADAPPERRDRRSYTAAAVIAVALIAAVGLLAVHRERARTVPASPPRPAAPLSARPASRPPAPAADAPPVSAMTDPPAPPAEISPSPALPAAVPAAPDLTPLSEEMRRLREDVARLRDVVVERAPRAPEPPPVPPSPENELLERARTALAEGRGAEADSLLAAALALSPGRADALAERAALYERRGMAKRAMDAWTRVADSDASPPALRERARSELRRLQALESARAAEAPGVRIAEVHPVKFQAPDDADELRALHVRIERAPDAPPPDPDALALDVVFYDRGPAADAVRPSSAVPAQTLRLDGAWTDPEPRTLVAVYRVPRGARADTAYHGFVARLLWHDRVIDEWSRPRDLAAPPAAFTESRAEGRP